MECTFMYWDTVDAAYDCIGYGLLHFIVCLLSSSKQMLLRMILIRSDNLCTRFVSFAFFACS
jgi:hypothetical protein